MNKIGLVIIAGVAVISILVINYSGDYITEQSILCFLNMLPTFIGILLAGVLTSLAIILAIIGTNEMIEMHELEKINNKNFYKTMSDNLKQNVCLILMAFLITSFLSIFCIEGTYILVPIKESVSVEVYKLLFVLETVLLISSFMATYDIIMGMFHIFDFKYKLSNENRKTE